MTAAPTAPTVIQSRLDELLNGGRLAYGGHTADSGERCAMEWVSYLAGEQHGDHPQCSSPVLARYVIRLNDRWPDEQRQALAPYLPRIVGTAGDGLDDARVEIARQALVTDLLPAWLRLVGMDAEADALSSTSLADLPDMLREIRSAAWTRRCAALESVRAAVREKLAGRAAAVAAADAVAVTVAGDPWGPSYDAAYKAALPIFQRAIDQGAAPKLVAIRELAAAVALDVLDRMIRPEVTQ